MYQSLRDAASGNFSLDIEEIVEKVSFDFIGINTNAYTACGSIFLSSLALSSHADFAFRTTSFASVYGFSDINPILCICDF